jgi:type IV pilus assembly protein PilM
MKAYFRELAKKMELKEKGAAVSIPGYYGLINLVEFPEMKTEELDQAVRFEARKHIPIPLDEIALSWEIDGKAENSSKEKKNQVMMVAAPRKEIARYEKLVKDGGMATTFMELETFSLVRSIIGDDPSTFILVDIGARTTNIILAEGGVIKVNRNIDSGGYDVTGAIAESMNISRQRAESLKREKKDLLSGSNFPLVIPSIEMISNEVTRIIAAYQEKNEGKKIDALILSGGSSKMQGLDQYFSKALGVKTIMGNPWRKIIVDPKLEALVKKELGVSFSVAIGLAMSGIEAYQRS